MESKAGFFSWLTFNLRGDDPQSENVIYIHTWNSKQPVFSGCLVKQPFFM